MPDNSSSNKRIAKNTILLYARMLYSMLISLYTSRVILQALGFEDYGLYNVVGSVVTMFVFLRSAMGNATNRYIAYAIGKDEQERLKTVFATCVSVHLIIAGVIVVLCEVVGLWMLFNKMVIPFERMTACFWVLQMSIFTCALGVICVPYDAEIIAHEKMSAFAFISILDSTLKLGVAFAVKYFPYDRLILYGFLLLFISVMNRVIYGVYCHRQFPETRLTKGRVDKSLVKEMFGVASWNLVGNMGSMVCSPVLNLFLNMFFGPVINAARGVAMQIQGLTHQFISNFQLAVIPQITKTYAAGNLNRMRNLIITGSKFSYFLFLFMALPIALEAKQILSLWLGNVPDHTVSFVRITLVIMLVQSCVQPLNVANLATGKIRKFQTWRGVVMVMMLPIVYIALKFGAAPEVVFVVQLVVTFTAQLVMLLIIQPLIQLPLREYAYEVFARPSYVTILASIIPFVIYHYLPKNFWALLLVCVVSIISVAIFVYLLGLKKNEREMVMEKVRPILKKIPLIGIIHKQGRQ